MNIYTLFPLIATITYVPLLITTLGSRPWQRRHTLFILFLIAAIVWSLTDIFLRSNLSPQLNAILLKLIIVTYTWMAVQFHCFASSFYAQGQGRWLPFAYVFLASVVVLVALGYVPEGVIAHGDKLYLDYGNGIVFIIGPLLALFFRNIYVFNKRLKVLDNPVLHNQIVSLLIGVYSLGIFTVAALLPWGREYPVSHFGNIINALILSYATIQHQLVDIKFVLRRAFAWLSLAIVGVISYCLLLLALHMLVPFELDLAALFTAASAAIITAIFVYQLRHSLFNFVNRALTGPGYDSRQRLTEFTENIHNVFSLSQQGGELLALVTKAIGCRKTALLFLERGGKDFTAQLVEPARDNNLMSSLRLRENSPIIEYLRREQRPLTREGISIFPEFRGLWEKENEEIKSSQIELFMPLISRKSLIGILVLDRKQDGKYTLEDFTILDDVTKSVAVSIEKEYIREQLREQEEELSVINRSSAIITSSLDVQLTYDSFIKELKALVDVSWAAIVIVEEDEIHFLAISSEIGTPWRVGERIPKAGTGTEWVVTNREAVIESDLSRESRFITGKYYLEHGLHSILYVPLVAGDEVIGSLAVASSHPNAYSNRHVKLLERLALQIAMPIENTRIYARAEQRARVDGLTGLLNRRSLDEFMTSEIGRHSRYGGVFSIIILDLDSFKAFNDYQGHLAGDELLKHLGTIIKGSIRGADQAFRYGGDEFAILLPQTKAEDANIVAERIRRRIVVELKTESVPVTASFGLANWPADGVGPIEVLAAADAALFQAKRNGGDQSQVYSSTPAKEDSNRRSPEDSKALSAIYALAATVDTRDHYTGSHSKKVNEYAIALAEALKLDPLEIGRLSTCASLHDIGKIGIGDDILNKPGKLTAEDWEIVKVHPQLGAAIVSHATQLNACIPGILHHHERYDGSGYPRGLKGEDIPLEARILAIADAFAAMTSERHYAAPLTHEQAIDELRRGSGTQFDPKLVEIFIGMYRQAPLVSSK